MEYRYVPGQPESLLSTFTGSIANKYTVVVNMGMSPQDMQKNVHDINWYQKIKQSSSTIWNLYKGFYQNLSFLIGYILSS